jgi:O-antigen/teichoic acid export membrane protein
LKNLLRSQADGGSRDRKTGDAETRSDLSELARSGALNAAGSISSGVFGFLITILVTRAFDAEGAGQFFVAVGAFGIVATISQLGADTGLIRTIARWTALARTSDLRRALGVALLPVVVVATGIAAVLFISASRLSDLLIRTGENALTLDLLRILSFFLPLAATAGVLLAATRGFGTMVPVTLIDRVGQPILRAGLLLLAITAGVSGTMLALSWAFPIAVELVVVVIWLAILVRAAEESGEHMPPAPWRQIGAEFWSFTSFRGVAAFLQVMVNRLDILLVGALASGFAAGVYAAVSRLITTGGFVQRAMILAMGPQISTLLARNEHERANALYQAATCWLILVSFPFFLMLAIFAPVVLEVFGSEFEAGRTAVVILALAMLVNMATGPATTILLMAGRSSWNLANAAISAAINIGLNVILIPRLGITGAAVAWAASIVVQNVLPVGQIWRSLRLHPFGMASLAAAVSAGVCFALIGLVVRSAWGPVPAALGTSTAVALPVYLAAAWSLRETLSLHVLASALRVRRRRPVGAQG